MKSETLSETRQKFEQWAQREGGLHVDRYAGAYLSASTNLALRAYEAGRLQGLEEAAKLIEPETKHSAYAAELWAAIREKANG